MPSITLRVCADGYYDSFAGTSLIKCSGKHGYRYEPFDRCDEESDSCNLVR